MRRALVVLVAACGGATAPARAPALPSDAPPGTRWITPRLPWHLGDTTGALVATGDTALAAGVTRGEIEEIDLTSGARRRVVSLGKRLGVESLTRMSDGRYLLAGSLDSTTQVAVLDPVTLAPTWFALERIAPVDGASATSRAVELAGGGILVGGADVALAIYDPRTLQRTRVLHPSSSWSVMAVTSSAVYARRDLSLSRIDLATGAVTPSAAAVAARRDTLVQRTYDKGKARLQILTRGKALELAAPMGYEVVLDDEGARLATVLDGVLTVYSTADAAVLARCDLSPQQMSSAKIAFVGARVLVAFGPTLRACDLATGAVSSLAEPYGPFWQARIDDAATATVIGAEVWRFAGGALRSTASLKKHTTLVAADAPGLFATRTLRPLSSGIRADKFPSVIAIKTLEGRPVREVVLPRETDNAWLGDAGKLVVSFGWTLDAPPKLVRVQGGKLFDIVTYNTDAMLDDVDVAGALAAFSLEGTTTLLDTTTGQKTHQVFIPHCDHYGSVELERGGRRRVLAYVDEDLILYDRTTGRALASARFADDPHGWAFLPHEDALLVRLSDRLVLWDPATNATRELAYAEAYDLHLSPDGTKLLVILHDGRLAAVDFATLRAAMVPGPTLPKADVPTACSTRDPFDLRDPTDADDATGDDDDAADHADDPGDDEEDSGD